MKNKIVAVRQGDLSFISFPNHPLANKPRVKKAKLADSEVTGHSHVLVAEKGKVIVSEPVKDLFMITNSVGASEVKHLNPAGKIAEHNTVTLPEGPALVVREQDWSPESGLFPARD